MGHGILLGNELYRVHDSPTPKDDPFDSLDVLWVFSWQ